MEKTKELLEQPNHKTPIYPNARAETFLADAFVQTIGIFGTDVHIAIQTFIQTAMFHGTDVETVSIQGFKFGTFKFE